DGKLGTSAPRFYTEANPLALNPDDPNGKDDVLILSQELHLPVGKPIKVVLRSMDVLHDFSVPQFRVKMDLVPGMVTRSWFTATKVGTYDLLCENLCGLAHFAMRGKVVVDEESAFQAWLATQPTFAHSQARKPGDAAAGKATYASCAACHGANGEGNAAVNAPKIAGQAEWYLDRQLKNFASGGRGSDERDTHGRTMAPMAAMVADDTARSNVIAYINALPDEAVPDTVTGDALRGGEFYGANCAACHGNAGEGVAAMNAPKLAGQNDWYLVRQLENFHQGIRGTSKHDAYGPQMVAMAGTLSDEEKIKDLVAYIKTLGKN
ncbi:MAG: c-type cytochrome, partial [Candidatus Sericytochromatia bacterium]|nr:c-type cytochrome [Candidatus Tanganyikabacteria bacterium]